MSSSQSLRSVHDSMGEMLVPVDALWQAQTQRSLENFPIGQERMPEELIYALLLIKRAAARTNARLGVLSQERAQLIVDACDELLAHDAGTSTGQGIVQDAAQDIARNVAQDSASDAVQSTAYSAPKQLLSQETLKNFPLKVWQTGSGTQTNMNANEVIATLANNAAEVQGTVLTTPIHPNDDVNHSQSSNDVFPSAMHLAALISLHKRLYPAADKLIATLQALEESSQDILKSGRTHLMDAVPLSFAQEVSGWRGLVEEGVDLVRATEEQLCKLALGATAVGTGLNTPDGFGAEVCTELTAALKDELKPLSREQTSAVLTSAPNKFHALTSKDALATSHGALKALAANMLKLANDVRLLASGPRTGLAEIILPANEPGSSIMPGKVNPTQCEALAQVCVQVMGNDVVIGIAASQGNFELNVYMPLIAYNYLQSVNLLADALESFSERCVAGITPDASRMRANLERSLMGVTCLVPELGYEQAAHVAQEALAANKSIREIVLEQHLMDEKHFDELWDFSQMV